MVLTEGDDSSEAIVKPEEVQEAMEQGDESEASEETEIQVKIINSATEKCDREVVAKMKRFRDLKAKRTTTEVNEKKLQLAMKESDGLIGEQQDSLKKMKDMVSGGLGVMGLGLGALGLGTLGVGAV